MGLMDRFRKKPAADPLTRGKAKDHPVSKLMGLDREQLRVFVAKAQLEAEEKRMERARLRREYSSLMERGQRSQDLDEQRLLASKAKQARRRFEMLEEDYNGTLKLIDAAQFLMDTRDRIGMGVVVLQQELETMMKLPHDQFRQGLDDLARERGVSLTKIQRMEDQAEAFTDIASPLGAQEEPEELALMREAGRRPVPDLLQVPPAPRPSDPEREPAHTTDRQTPPRRLVEE